MSLVIIRSYTDPHQAESERSYLRHHGIHAFMLEPENEDEPFVSLLVHEDEGFQSLSILDKLDLYEEEENASERGTPVACPTCGSADTRIRENRPILSIFTWLFLLKPYPYTYPRAKCTLCGRSWIIKPDLPGNPEPIE